MQPSKSDQSNSPAVQSSTPVTVSHPKRVRILLRIFSPLMRLPLLGGLGRTTWLILSVVALAVFVAGGFWARTTAVDAPAPPRFSWTWWSTSLEFHRELQLASLSDAEIESVAVVRMSSGTDRIFIAGRNALLAFSDDAGHTWTELNYDPLMGGFAIMGQRAPFPDNTGILAPTSQPGVGNAKAAKPTTKVPPKTVTPALRQQQQQDPAPVYQVPPQKQTAPPSTAKPPAKKPAAALSLLSSFVPSVWASEKSPPVQQSPTAANQNLVQQLRAAGTTGATGSLQPQPPPEGIPAICRADDGAVVLVMSGERAAISRDFGQTWQATSLDALIEPVPGNSGFTTSDFIAGKALPSGKHVFRLETAAARLRGRLGDTLLFPQMLPRPELDPVNPARTVYRISGNAIWAITGYKFPPAPGPLGNVYRYTTDAQGSRWLPAISAFAAELRDVAFSVGGSTGYIVGAHGTILRTRNGGASWQPLTREALHPGQALSATTAGGSYWRLPPPWTYPLLFLFVGALAAAIVVSAVPGANSLAEAADWITLPERPSHGGVALVTVSDRPLGEDDVDNLGFRGIARGVAGFLRNPKTQLPITLAINGAWGTGKSSLMNLICGELKRAGFRPVWFNAWHHQEDENLLASLLQSVRGEAAPSPLREGGLGFRLRLGWFRFRRFYPRALAMVAIFIGLWAAESWYETDAVYLRNYFAETSGSSAETKSAGKPQIAATPAQNAPTSAAPSATPGTPSGNYPKPDTAKGAAQNGSPGWFDTLVNSLASLHEGSDDLSKKYGLPRFLSVLYLLFQILPAALQKLKAFTVTPASLLHFAAPGVAEKKIEAQTSFRMRFAKEFADVTRALGEKHRLVIFVDDLDRCKPANVAEMMEAINYVTVAGECAFVLGLETEAVRAALGLSFSAMAQEVEPANPANSSPDGAKTVAQEDSAEVERRKRADFARRYVEKLINIEMNVPALDEHRKQALFTIAQPAAAPGDPFERARKIAKAGSLLEPAAVFLLVLALGWGAGRALVHFAEWQAHDYFQDKEEANAAALTGPVVNPPAPASGAAQNAASANPAPVTPQAGTGKAPDVLPGEDPLPAVMFRNPLIWIVIAVLLIVVIQLLARVPIPPAKDSQEFTFALAAWGLVAGTGLHTPRSTKRFLNRLRFLAMRQQPPPVQLPGLIKLLLTAKQEKDALQKEEARAAWASSKNPIPEAILVALASLETYAKQAGNNGLDAPHVGAMLEKLSKEAAEAVFQGDFHSTPFLAELGRMAAPVTEAVPEFNDEKSMRDFFDALVKTKGLASAAKAWADAAAAKISGHLDAYFDLGGGVEFT